MRKKGKIPVNEQRKEVKLKVLEARKRDVGRNIARLNTETFKKLNISTGEIVEIIGDGQKSTAAIAWQSYDQDQKLDIVRIDSRLRSNSGSKVDSIVVIRKTEAKLAKSIVLTPHNLAIKTNIRFESFVKRKLLSYPVTKGDLIYISIGIGREIMFNVASLNPENEICVIKQRTLLHIRKDPEKFPDKKPVKELADGLTIEDAISSIKDVTNLLNFIITNNPLKDEVSDLNEKINTLNNRLDQITEKMEEFLLKMSVLEDKKEDSDK